MNFAHRLSLATLIGWSLSASAAVALTIPSTENFDSTNQNWKNSDLTQNATWVGSGGPNGASDAFIESSFTTPATGTPGSAQVVFRARDTVNSSNNVFFGDWIAGGVTSIDFWIRQDSNAPISIGLRLPTSLGFPAMLGRVPDPILPDTWTHVTMAINATNPQLLDETGPTHANFNAVFSNVTYLQVFANLSSQPNSATINFDIDRVSIVPEPSTWLMAAFGLPALGLAIRARRRRLAA